MVNLTSFKDPRMAFTYIFPRIIIQAKSEFPELEMMGTAVRGAFLNRLRAAQCPYDQYDCGTCQRVDHCIYPWMSKSPNELMRSLGRPLDMNAPQGVAPFALKVLEGQRGKMCIDFPIFGRMLLKANVLLETMKTALKKFGHDGYTSELLYLKDAVSGKEYSPDAKIDQDTFEKAKIGGKSGPEFTGKALRLHFPVMQRLVYEEQELQDFHLIAWLSSLSRRLGAIDYFYGDRKSRSRFLQIPEAAPDIRITRSKIHEMQIFRSSSRQKRMMPWDGFMGSVDLSGEGLKEIFPAIKAAEVVQVGKGCTTGHGGCEIEVLH